MNIYKKISFLTIIYIFTIWISLWNISFSSHQVQEYEQAWHTLSSKYETATKCSTERRTYNARFPWHTRTECFEYRGSYHYFLCWNQTTCSLNDIQSSTQTSITSSETSNTSLSSSVSIPYKSQLDKVIDSLRKTWDTVTAEKLISNLTKLEQQYSKSPNVLIMIQYLKSESQKVLWDFQTDSSLTDAEKFLCDIGVGNCSEGSWKNMSQQNNFSQKAFVTATFSKRGETQSFQFTTHKKIQWLNKIISYFSLEHPDLWIYASGTDLGVYIYPNGKRSGTRVRDTVEWRLFRNMTSSISETPNGPSICTLNHAEWDSGLYYVTDTAGLTSGEALNNPWTLQITCLLSPNKTYYYNITSTCSDCTVDIRHRNNIFTNGTNYNGLLFPAEKINDTFFPWNQLNLRKWLINFNTHLSGNWTQYIRYINQNEVLALEFDAPKYIHQNIFFHQDSVWPSVGRGWSNYLWVISETPWSFTPVQNVAWCWMYNYSLDDVWTDGGSSMTVMTNNMIKAWRWWGTLENAQQTSCILESGKKYYFNVRPITLTQYPKRTDLLSDMKVSHTTCEKECYVKINVQSQGWFSPPNFSSIRESWK